MWVKKTGLELLYELLEAKADKDRSDMGDRFLPSTKVEPLVEFAEWWGMDCLLFV